MSDSSTNLIADLRANAGQASSGPFVGRPVLILTTTGAQSGERRETPVVYSRDHDAYVIAASDSGAPTHPAWYHNLVADPQVTIEVGSERFEMTARVVDGAERRRLYDRHAQLHPGFRDYETQTTRVIPVVVLEP